MRVVVSNSPVRGRAQQTWRIGALISGALVVPTVAFSVLILFTRHFGIESAWAEYAALVISVGLGSPSHGGCRTDHARVHCCITLVVVLAVWLVVYGFGFVCGVYQNCL